MLGTPSLNDTASRRSFSTPTIRTDESIFLSRSWPTDGPTGGSKSYESTSVARRSARPAAPPLLQTDPELREPDVVGEYQRALAAGDVGAIVAAFESDGYTREPAGGSHVHRGRDNLRSFYELLFSNGGIPLEYCAAIDDGRSCALEYNIVRWGKSELSPTAGMTVYVRGDSGKLAAARIYDDTDPSTRPV
ncbi:MAG: hypothetical protein WAL84_05110, partial [Candidatus Dormiibacterota bacterium]